MFFEVTEAVEFSFIANLKQHLTRTSQLASHPEYAWGMGDAADVGGVAAAVIVAVVMTWMSWGNGCLISAAGLIIAAQSSSIQVGVLSLSFNITVTICCGLRTTHWMAFKALRFKRIIVLKTEPKMSFLPWSRSVLGWFVCGQSAALVSFVACSVFTCSWGEMSTTTTILWLRRMQKTGFMHIISKETGIYNSRWMIAAAGTEARRLKEAEEEVRIYDNRSKTDETTGEDGGGGGGVDHDGRCCFSSAGAGCLRWCVVLIVSPQKLPDILSLSLPTLL